MSFLYPLGLLGLLGIPVLILIYILKSKYSEQTVSSTYLWTLSERFLKRKKPISPLVGIISLILQILAVLLVSLLIAHPIITVRDSAKEYCFVLDSSGSMNMEENGISRFTRAKNEIRELIRESTDGSMFTLIVASDTASAVYEKLDDKKQALRLLEEQEGGYSEIELSEALDAAQKYFSENPSAVTYFMTDTEYAQTENIKVINVAQSEKNVALSEIVWDLSSGILTVSGRLNGYGEEGSYKVSVYPDGAEAPLAEAQVQVTAGETAGFQMQASLTTFTSLRIALESDDAQTLDNEYIVYDVKSEDIYKILIVSDTPFFLENVLKATGHTKITVISPDDYDSEKHNGYGLYIFECCTPAATPTDGAVWYFDPKGSVPDSGFSVQGEVSVPHGEILEMTASTASVARKLCEGVSGDEIVISEYVKCSLYRNFTTLFSYKGNPIVFAGNNLKGYREVVFAFDLHNSNLPLLVDFIVMTENLMTFSFPDVLEKVNYCAGDEVGVNVIAGCESIRVESPKGEVLYLGTDVATPEFTAKEAGTYKVTVTVSGIPRIFYVYSSLPESESEPLQTAELVALSGKAEEGGFDGTFDPLWILFVVLAVVFLADWTVYCYEKYQLR